MYVFFSMAEMSVAEMSIGRNVCGRNVRGQNVLAETSVAEMSVAEMSEHLQKLRVITLIFILMLKCVFHNKTHQLNHKLAYILYIRPIETCYALSILIYIYFEWGLSDLFVCSKS